MTFEEILVWTIFRLKGLKGPPQRQAPCEKGGRVEYIANAQKGERWLPSPSQRFLIQGRSKIPAKQLV